MWWRPPDASALAYTPSGRLARGRHRHNAVRDDVSSWADTAEPKNIVIGAGRERPGAKGARVAQWGVMRLRAAGLMVVQTPYLRYSRRAAGV